MSPNDVPTPVTKAALLRRLRPGTKLTLMLGDKPILRPRTVHKASTYQLELHAEDKPGRALSYFRFNTGDQCFLSAGGFFIVSDDAVVTYLWGHQSEVADGQFANSPS
jgi:hypothetical protein